MASLTSRECQLDVFEELDSTNKYLVRQLASEPQLELPRLCVAAHQTAGVGRRGRTWHSPVNSITLSLIQRFSKPSSSLMGLSLVAGIAIAELVKEQIGQQRAWKVGVKWPNDILVEHRKLGGILIEVPQSSSAECIVITGIGLNLSQGKELLQVDQPYALLETLVDELPDASYQTGQIAGAVLQAYQLFEQSGWPGFAERWAAVDYLRGRSVSVIQAGEQVDDLKPVTGTALGVAADGGLIVEQGHQQKTYYSGEISVRAEPD